MARAATSQERTLYRTPGKWSKWRAAIYEPTTIYTARINQAFSAYDSIVQITYDGGSGTLSDVKADMMLLVGSSAGAHDKGITRVKSIDVTTIDIAETSDIEFADNDYLTIIDDFGLWARHVKITSEVPYMDGDVAYSDQHASPDPIPIMGSHRVLKLTGVTVSAEFDGSDSYVVGGLSSITGYAWVAPGSSASSGMDTATPTITWNSVGWKKIYLTVTAANGKTFMGVRYVYIWNDANLPPKARIENARGDVESGGWSFDITMFGDCDLSTIRDHALVVVFAEDYFGTTQQDIGPVAGSENIEIIGWIARENINWNPKRGSVKFTVYGAHYWFSQIPAFPDGVEFTTATPSAWTQFQNLTVDKGLWHFLHWRTTATRIMDVFLTSDTKYTKEVSSVASNLWEQIREMGFLQIYARALVNAQGQLYIEVHPQLVAEASRDWTTVFTIAKGDWQREIAFDHVTKPEVAVVSLSGVAVNSSGVGAAYFSLSPGHAYPHYGAIDIQDRLLVASQADANQKSGLYRGWKNNPYPDIPIQLIADIRLIDICPRQKCALVIAEGDTERGITFNGDILPVSVTLVTDPSTGRTYREVVFEAASSEDLSINGDIPGGRSDISIPPTPSFPPFPDLFDFPIIPGTIEPTAVAPKVVLIHDTTYGLMYTENFNAEAAADIKWVFFNSGLTADQKASINFFFRTPSGVCYCGKTDAATSDPDDGFFVARAPYLGGTWTVLYDVNNLQSGGGNWGVTGIAYNPLVPETVGVVLFVSADNQPFFYLGEAGVFTKKVALSSIGYRFPFVMSYGAGKWLLTSYGNQVDGMGRVVSADGSTLETTGLGPADMNPSHVRAGTTGKTFHDRSGNGLIIGTDNLTSSATNTDTDISFNEGDIDQNPYFACDPTGTYCMTRYGAGWRGRSSDGGSTWGAIANLLAFDGFYFQYAGGIGVASRWIAAGGTSIYYSADFGDAWESRVGNLTGLVVLPALDMVRVLEY